jgi:hypothetical protein
LLTRVGSEVTHVGFLLTCVGSEVTRVGFLLTRVGSEATRVQSSKESGSEQIWKPKTLKPISRQSKKMDKSISCTVFPFITHGLNRGLCWAIKPNSQNHFNGFQNRKQAIRRRKFKTCQVSKTTQVFPSETGNKKPDPFGSGLCLSSF